MARGSGALGVRRGEGRMVVLVISTVFVATAGLTIGESGVSSLFFSRVGADALPVVYLAQGGTGFVAMLALTGVLGRFDRRRAYVVLPVVLAIAVAIGRALVELGATPVYWALWLTVTAAYLVQAVFLWGAAGLVTDTRAAKRLFPLFGAGGILGAVVGGLVTRPLAVTVGAENLLAVWIVAMVATSALVAATLGVRRRRARAPRRAHRPSAFGELARGFGFVRRSRLLRWMTLGAILFSVLFYSLYLPYAQAATARFPDPDRLAGFFGLFWAAVTATAFLISVLLTNRLLGRFGAVLLVLVLPILYVGAFAILFASAAFATLVAIRFGLNVWLQGVSAPSWETLVNVVPEERRDQTRAFLNGGPAQAGTAITGALQLVAGSLSIAQIAVIGLGAALLTILVVWNVRRSYATALVDAMRAGRPNMFADVVPGTPVALRTGADGTEIALAAMRDDDVRMRRLAVALLEPSDPRAVASLSAALEDGDALVRAGAISSLAGSADPPVETLRRGQDDADPAVRLAAVTAMRDLGVDTALEAALGDEDPTVAARAAVRLLPSPARAAAADTLRSSLASEDPSVRAAAVRELGDATPEDAAALVRPLADDVAPTVRAAALRVLGSAAPVDAAEAGLRALASGSALVRSAAMEALSTPDVGGLGDRIRRYARSQIALAERDHALSITIPEDGDASALLRDALRARGRSHALAAMAALGALSDDVTSVQVALENLEATGPQTANALETIEATLGRAVAAPAAALWEPASTAAAHPAENWLEPLRRDDDPLVRSCAELVRSALGAAANDGGERMTRARTSMTPMERVLMLRRTSLFGELTPSELLRVAEIAEERAYDAGDVVAAEGETGDELHIVVEGEVRVARASDGETIARRGPGDVVGEMALIRRAPRIATIVADGTVRTLRIGQREFEAMLRERPDVALGVMRVLADRLAALSDAAPDTA